LPPGFDAEQYRDLNPDVAAAYPDDRGAQRHYVENGVRELRRIMPDGVGISDVESRMLKSGRDRRNWLDWLRKKSGSRGLATLVENHPRAAWLSTAFNLASYLRARPDVAALIDTPLQGAFHFLEFGVEEGAYGIPQSPDPRHLQLRYGDLFADLERDETPKGDMVLRRLREAGHTALDTSVNEAELWELFGIPGDVLSDQFDHEYYHAVATRAGMPPDGAGRLDCIAHFCTKGYEAGLQGHPDHDLDVPFYLQHWVQIMEARLSDTSEYVTRVEARAEVLNALADTLDQPVDRLIAAAGDVDAAAEEPSLAPVLYHHWLRVGLRQGTAPNVRFWSRRYFGLSLPREFEARMRDLARTAAFEDSTLVNRLTRLLGSPMPYLEHAPDLTRAEANALADLGDMMLSEGFGSLMPKPGNWRPEADGSAVFDLEKVLKRLEDRLVFGSNDAIAQTGEARSADLLGLRFLRERIVGVEQVEQAEWLYRTVLSQFPDHERALGRLVTLMTLSGRAAAAHQLRMQWRGLPGPKRGSGARNLLALAAQAIDEGRLHMALRSLEEAAAVLEGSHALMVTHEKLGARLLGKVWARIGTHAEDHGLEPARDFLSRVLRLATPALGLIPDRPVSGGHIALVANLDLYQCKLYRVDQKVEQLRAAGFEVTVFDQWQGLDGFRAGLEGFAAAIFYRVPAFPDIMRAIAACSAHGVPSFYEIDDMVFDGALFPPPYENYAGQITRSHYRDMACGVPLYDHAMRLCDYGIGSTRVLCEAMAERVRSGRAFAHHNALGRAHLDAIAAQGAAPARPDGGPVVLFYGSGTLAHKEDFHTILEPALAEVLRRYGGRVELQLVGSYGDFEHLDPRSDNIRMMPPVWDFEQYCAMVAGGDINLSVLHPTPVTDAKSEIKWMEAAMFAIPSVVSRTATHADVIAHGETGFLCDSIEDFVRSISALVEDADLRHRVGEAARDRVMRDYGLDAMGQNLGDIFARIAPPERRKPRVAVINVFYPPQAIGGATRVVHDNVTDIVAEYGDAFDLTVICTREGGTPYELSAYMQDGVPVWAIGATAPEVSEMTARDARMGDVFGGLLDRLAPDLVHFHCIQRLTSTIVDVTRKRDIPYVITMHDGWWISPRQFLLDPGTDRLETYDYSDLSRPDTSPRARVLWPALDGARYVLPVSEAFAKVCRDCHLRNVRAVENGVSRFPEVAREPHPEGRVRLAHLGGTERHKGLHLVRSALLSRAFENLEVLVVDHALPPGHVEHDVWGTTPMIRQGKVAQAQVDALYSRIDVLLAPSVWPESYGLVTREALASGVWVVASDRGAVGADVTEGVNGHIVTVDDYSDLARVLARIDADPARYAAPPVTRPEIRPAAAQARDLAGIYEEILNEENG